MQITFYGVRGSIASPGKHTAKYGGNTACVLVEIDAETDDSTLIIFDAGTGIRELGDDLSKRFKEVSKKPDIHILFSHFHWDHIQGLPFFQPIYHAKQKIYIGAAHMQEDQVCAVLGQLAYPHFPFPSEQLAADIDALQFDIDGKLPIKKGVVSTQSLNHPGGGSGYRIDTPQGSMVYITDNELEPPTAPPTTKEQWRDFVYETDVLIHDAMFLSSEQEAHKGWGHSTITQALELARDAKVKKLILFHHEPKRSDIMLDSLLTQSRHWMKKHNSHCEVYMAKEGDKYQISAQVVPERDNAMAMG